MKITLEQEIKGSEQTERTCISIYDNDEALISSFWISKGDNPYLAMEITKALLESCIKRYGWGMRE